MAPFLTNIFRSGRSTPTPTSSHTPINEPPTPCSTTTKLPPSAYKTAHPSPTPAIPMPPVKPRETPSPGLIKIRDYAQSPKITVETLAYAVRPLPPTPEDSPLKGHNRSASSASALSSKSSLKRNGRVAPRPGPPVAFTSPRTHTRTASGPSPSPLSTTNLRARASTLPLLNDTPTARDDKEPSTPVTITLPRPGTTTRTPESKKRPAALKLRTSNLTPPQSPSPTPARPPPLFQLESLSTNAVDANETLIDKASLGRLVKIVSASYVTPRMPSLRRAESAQALIQPTRPERSRSSSQGNIHPSQSAKATINRNNSRSSRKITPARVIVNLPVTTGVQTPSRTSSTPFEQISLPWSSSSASDLSQELGPRFDELLDYTLDRLPPSSPRVLRPSVLRTSANEDARLRAELDRLRDKYTSTTRYRDGLLYSMSHSQVDEVVFRKTAESLKRAIARCDRLARQIFICNDQIRQIEIQGEEHVVGALRVALARQDASDNTSISGAEDVDGSPVSSSGSNFDAHDAFDGEHAEVHQAVYMSTPHMDNLDVLPHAKDRSKRMSTATIISLSQLGFPLPPTRHSPSPTASTYTSPTNIYISPSTTLSPPEHRELLSVPTTARSASTGNLEVTLDATDEILIYPPGHRRSASVPLLNGPHGMDMPHTPWRGQHDFSPSEPAHGTPPLRIKGGGKRQKMEKAKSMTHKRFSSDVTRRARRGRESSLECPESILLRLATAGLWESMDQEASER